MRAIALSVLALVVAGCGGAADPFAHDRSQPLDLRESARAAVSTLTVLDVSYAGSGDRVPAYLVLPGTKGRHPGVVILHGAGGSRQDFLDEAIDLAGHGAVALTLTSAYERSVDARVISNTEPVSVDRGLWIRSVVDVRRALDLLRARADVDPERLALVGYSRGGVWAADAAAVEHPAAVILMGTPATPSRGVFPAKDRGLVEPLDPVHWVGRIPPARLLIQAARRDTDVKPAQERTLDAAARQPKELRWYDADHRFDGAAFRDQLAFLRRALGLS